MEKRKIGQEGKVKKKKGRISLFLLGVMQTFLYTFCYNVMCETAALTWTWVSGAVESPKLTGTSKRR